MATIIGLQVLDSTVISSAHENLNSCSWSTISSYGQAGTGNAHFDIGDTKSIVLSGKVGSYLTLSSLTLNVFIIEFNYRSTNGIYFQGFKNTSGTPVSLIDSKYWTPFTNGTMCLNMNHWGNNNYGGWKGCDLRYDMLGSTNQAPSGYGSIATTSRVGYDATSTAKTSPKSNTLMAALPSDLRTVLAAWTVYTDNKGNSSTAAANVTTSVDYLPCLSEYEVWGRTVYSNSNEASYQSRMAYYANGGSSYFYKHTSTSVEGGWWLRSPVTNSTWFCLARTTAPLYSDTYNSFAIAPAFRIA